MAEESKITTSIDPLVRQQSVDRISLILRELQPEEAYLFDCGDALSDCSELSEPFSEMAELRPKPIPKKEEKKTDKGMSFKQTLSGYPPEVSKLYEDVYEVLKENPTATVEEKEEPYAITSFEHSPEYLQKCEALLDCFHIDKYLAEKKKEEEKQRKSRRRGGSPPSAFDIDETIFPSFWRLLEAESKRGDFQITPGGYNRYAEPTPDWMQRLPLPTDSTDDSRNKCERWLKIRK